MNFKLNTYTALIPILFLSVSYAQPTEKWVKKYNSGWDRASSITVDNSGNVIVTGDNFSDIRTVKYNPNGTALWATYYNGTASAMDLGHEVKTDASGNIYITCESTGIGSGYDIVLLKYDPVGNLLWSKRYDGPIGKSDAPAEMILDNAGNIYITGYCNGDIGGQYDIITLKYDPSGTLVWSAIYDGLNAVDCDIATGIALDQSGNVFVTGTTTDAALGSSTDCITLKYNSAGVYQSGAQYVSTSADISKDIAIDSNGDVYITGTTITPIGGNDYLSIKYDNNMLLTPGWPQFYNDIGNGFDMASSLFLDPSDNVYVCGNTTGSSADMDISIIKYDTFGNTIWTSTFDDAGLSYESMKTAVMDDSVNIYITGIISKTFSSGGGFGFGMWSQEDYLTIKVDSTGTVKWIKTYAGSVPDTDWAEDIAIDKNGCNVYVTGSVWEGVANSFDYATICYNQCTEIIIQEPICNLYIPNVFSPNSDGNNDIYFLQGKCINKLEFSIYDRWGERVFETNDMSNGWDGKLRNKELSTGVFVYKLSASLDDGSEIVKSGTITLLK